MRTVGSLVAGLAAAATSNGYVVAVGGGDLSAGGGGPDGTFSEAEALDVGARRDRCIEGPGGDRERSCGRS